ncbi:hypothetical protein INP51_15345 [Blautia liquoris]|uniref:Uncharacterized protein n=1 Tax=Blautia liquoris TaxID=2779518 RepID=A0A7M2RG24_9FIRM|nr:DUF6145 family protein [Blautia liquoris]QOV19293.1 hypothetical protein INP51_15345 [Blautia liquoris]
MHSDKVVLCASSAYEQKYYFNSDFNSLPETVQDELHAICVLYTVDIGGIFQLLFDEDGKLEMKTEALSADAMYDDIGAALRIKKLREEKKELFESLELFYKVFYLGEDIEDD